MAGSLIYGELVRAQLHNSASDLTPTATGLIYFNTGDGLPKWYNGSAWKTAVDTNTTQTISGKTLTSTVLTSPIIDTPLIGDYADYEEQSGDPSTPSTGFLRLYAKNDNKLYMKDDTGLVSAVGSGSGSGEINVVENPSDANAGWDTNAGGVTVATTTTATDLPLGPAIDTAIKITPSSGSDYARYRWTMPAALKQRKLKVEWHQRPLAGYASGDFKVEVYKNSASDYTGSYTEFVLSTDVSGTSSIPNQSGKYTTTFDADSGDYYELRLVRTAGATALNLAAVVVGPGTQPQGAAVDEWKTYTPTGAWTTNTTYTGKWRRVGDSMQVMVDATLAGAPNTADFTAALPSGYTIDTAKITATASLSHPNFGSANILDSGTTRYVATVTYNSSTAVSLVHTESGSNNGVVGTTSPITFASGDHVVLNFVVPVAEWSGSGTVNVAQNDVEYVYNSGTWDAADTTSFAYGPVGGQITGALTANRTKRVRFQTPIQATDHMVFEIDPLNSGKWSPLPAGGSSVIQLWEGQNTNQYGGGRLDRVAGSATDVDVVFGQYRLAGGATYGAAGDSWNDVANARWRVKKIAAGNAVGFGSATSTSSGLVSTTTQTFAGAKTFSDGIVLGNETLTVYDEGSVTVTFEDVLDGANNDTATLRWVKVGKLVTIMMGDILVRATAGTTYFVIASGGTPLATNGILPAGSENVYAPCHVRNSGSDSAAPGFVALMTDGAIRIYRDGAATAWTGTASANNGIPYGFSCSYRIA